MYIVILLTFSLYIKKNIEVDINKYNINFKKYD